MKKKCHCLCHMSYETNPILNRIKLSKGWKTSTFPTNSLNYSRDTMLWFKVYLFLKVYLLLHGFRLLASEIRLSEKYTKILYLSVAKQSFPPQKSKSKWKAKSFLQKLQSPLTKRNNKKARFLLYLDLQKLKKNSLLYFNNTRKKTFSHNWIAKPRRFSWINTSYLVYNWRKSLKHKQQCRWKKKKKFYWKKINSASNNSKRNVFNFSKNTYVIAKKELFWKKKQRNVSSLLTKMQKNLFFFERYSVFLGLQMPVTSITPSLVKFWAHQSQRKKLFLKQIQSLYRFIKKKNEFTNREYLNSGYRWRQKKKYMSQEIFFWLHFMKQFRLSQRNPFFASSFAKRIIFQKQKSFFYRENNICISNAKTISKKGISLKKMILLNHFFAKKKLYNLIPLTFFSKTQFFQRFQKITLARLFLWKRITQKKKFLIKKRKIIPQTSFKNFSKKRDLFYRCAYKQNYRKFLSLSTNVKLTYLIEDLIKKYFTLTVKIKVCWPLSQFKNLKFYRLVYPKYKHRGKSKKTFFLNIQKNDYLARKKYFYIGHNTQHLKYDFDNALSTVKKKSSFSFFKNSKFLLDLIPNQPLKKTILNFWQQEKKKKNKYLLLKKKIVASKSEKRLSWSSKAFFTSGLITTLTLFVKYLDPQPVVDHLARIIGGTKKHVATLKLIETILRTFHLKRGLGYRIALIGRINGANKSRTIYLRKLNRNRSRQSFSKNVNFALAHARATIGTFAIKLWVYS